MSNLSIDTLKLELKNNSVEEDLAKLAELFPGEVVFSTSFSFEDQVISHIIFSKKLNI